MTKGNERSEVPKYKAIEVTEALSHGGLQSNLKLLAAVLIGTAAILAILLFLFLDMCVVVCCYGILWHVSHKKNCRTTITPESGKRLKK